MTSEVNHDLRRIDSADNLLHRPQESVGGTLADLMAVRVPFCGRVAEMESDKNPRIRVLIGCLGERRICAHHRCRIAAGTPGRKRYAAVLERDLVPEELLQYLGSSPTFDGVP